MAEQSKTEFILQPNPIRTVVKDFSFWKNAYFEEFLTIPSPIRLGLPTLLNMTLTQTTTHDFY